MSFHIAYLGRSLFELESESYLLNPGEAMLFRNRSGQQRIGFGSGIGFQLQPRRLLDSLRSLSGRQDLSLPAGAVLAHLTPQQCDPFRSLFQLVDQLLREDPRLPQLLGIEDQLYRLLAIQLLRSMDLLTQLDGVACGSGAMGRPGAVLDRLLAYIEARARMPLMLTDLEACSGYSARRLQQLFRHHFDCTPMQYVRRRRLAQACHELQQIPANETITGLARRYGYREVTHFSADFRRQFGVPPSQLLRTARSETLRRCPASDQQG